MSYTAFHALVRRDLRLFFMDKRAVAMSFAAPILIASFFGYIFGGVTNNAPPSKLNVAVINQDTSPISAQVVAALKADPLLNLKPRSLDEAREAVRGGKLAVAAVIPAGFAEGAAKAFFRGGAKPQILFLFDPSHATDMQVVRGVMMQHIMEVIGREAMAGLGFRRTAPGAPAAFSMPFTVEQEPVTARKGVTYNSMAHSFAGMSVQFILFMGIDAGLIVLAQRRSGMWKRLQAAPLSRYTMIGSRAASAAIVGMVIMLVVFGFARVVFGVRVEGSFAGFLGVCGALGIMTATFGLLIAVLGKTPEATRGIAILVTLILVMLGGSWVPAFIFPQWLQKISFAVPTRWAVDGLDAMVWRGSGFEAALAPIGALLAFAAAFGAIAVWRFRWASD